MAFSCVGTDAKATTPPPGAGRVQVRSVRARPSVVLSTSARDLNIVLLRPAPLAPGNQFDLILATNILLYYDVFEQSLAAANIAAMLRPAGCFCRTTASSSCRRYRWDRWDSPTSPTCR